MNNVLDFGNPIHSAAAVVVSSKFFPTWSVERCLDVCFALLEIGEHRPDIMLANLRVEPAQSELKTVGEFKIRFECMLTTAMEVGALVADTTSKWDAKGYKPAYNLPQQKAGSEPKYYLRISPIGVMMSLYDPFKFVTMPAESFQGFRNSVNNKSTNEKLRLYFVEGMEEAMNSCNVFVGAEVVMSQSVTQEGVTLVLNSGSRVLIEDADLSRVKFDLEGFTSILEFPSFSIYVK